MVVFRGGNRRRNPGGPQERTVAGPEADGFGVPEKKKEPGAVPGSSFRVRVVEYWEAYLP